MPKAVKRQAQSKLNDASTIKSTKFYDLNLITKDISMLESYYDFIDGDNDIINEYLINHDLNDFLNYFKSYHLYKSAEFAIVFKVCTEILMRIAGDLKEKYSLVGQNFADLFIENYKAVIHQYLIANTSKSGVKSCLKFVTGLILQGSDVALKLASAFNIFQSSFIKQLFVRSAQDDDVHTCVLECFAAFFVVGSNVIIRRLCEYKSFFVTILRDLRFDKCDNVKLMIEILHDKIIKNNAVSKTTKVKLFNATLLRHLVSVYDWKGEAQNYDNFRRLTEVDERCSSIHSELHSLIKDICSINIGIAFNDDLCGQSKSQTLNKTLFKLITSDVMNDFFIHPLKNEIVKTILQSCPDIIPNFVEHLSVLLEKIVPESRTDLLKVVIQCYEISENNKINTILTESLSYMDGEKFTEVAMLLSAPTKSLIEVVKTTDKVDKCRDAINDLKKAVMNNCERIITWMNTSELFESSEQRIKIKLDFQQKIQKTLIGCEWNDQYESMITKDLNDKAMFPKLKKEFRFKEHDIDEEVIFDEEVDEETKDCIERLNQANKDGNTFDEKLCDDALKKCLKQFLSAPFTSVKVLAAIAETIVKGRVELKKKQRRKLFDIVLKPETMAEYWPLDEDSEARRESIRNSIFDVIVSCVDSSGTLMKLFYENVHPMRLLSVYGGSLAHCDQNVLYLLSIHQIFETKVPDFDVVVFGSAVHEHYRFEANNCVIQWRPVVEAQCLNLLIDERMVATIIHFPIHRQSPVSEDNKIHMEPAHRAIYDPCFLLEWIAQVILTTTADGSVVDQTIDLKALFSRRIVQFLVVCQSSHCEKIRLASRMLIGRVIRRLEDVKDDNAVDEFPMKIQLKMILTHMIKTIDTGKTKKEVRLPSVFTNIYVRMLQLLNNPEKKMFGPVWEMIITKDFFDLKYVPDFVYMLYSDKEDYRNRQLWCLQLLADSVKDYDDFLVLVNTKVFVDVLSLYGILDQSGKVAVLTLLKRCVSIVKVAEKMRRYPGFITWLICTMRDKTDKENRPALVVVVESLLRSLDKAEDIDCLQRVLAIDL